MWCASCDAGVLGTYDWTFCKGTAEYLMQHLLNNASAGLVWEGYDSQYNYYSPLEWSFWGLFGVDNTNAVDKTYTARKNFYTLSQISKYVRPGAQRIGVSGSVSSLSPLLAFNHPTLGQITIVGINTSGSATTLSGALASLPTVPYLNLYYTSATTNLANGGSVAVNNGVFSATIPANCVFTLTGFTGVNVALTNPVNGAQFSAPATIPLAATATSTAGSIALVGFYNGATELGEATSAPYGFTWNSVPMGNYALTAVAGDILGNIGTSAVVNVTVVGALAQIGVTPANAAVVPGGQQQFTAMGADLLGHTLVPQPPFSWSVSGGGTIDGTGLFTAGSAAGGPFSVAAASGGITGTASVSVVAVSGGTIGNTKNGTSTDTMWDNGPWINLGRFQAGSNMVVSTMHAKVGAIAGGCKCAIYTDNGGNARALLGGTAEVTNATNGWNVFPLTQSLVLTNGQDRLAGHLVECYQRNGLLLGHQRHPPLGAVQLRGVAQSDHHDRRQHFRLLYLRGRQCWASANAHVHRGDSREPEHIERGHTAIHRHRHLFGRHHAKPDSPSDLGLVEHGGGCRHHRGFGHGDVGGDDDHLGGAGGCDE